jgi:hypothetical protein
MPINTIPPTSARRRAGAAAGAAAAAVAGQQRFRAEWQHRPLSPHANMSVIGTAVIDTHNVLKYRVPHRSHPLPPGDANNFVIGTAVINAHTSLIWRILTTHFDELAGWWPDDWSRAEPPHTPTLCNRYWLANLTVTTIMATLFLFRNGFSLLTVTCDQHVQSTTLIFLQTMCVVRP